MVVLQHITDFVVYLSTLLPFSRTSPKVGFRMPAIMDRIVVLPQPLGPTIATNSPLFTSKDRLSIALVSSVFV